jgi:hypothetical protein
MDPESSLFVYVWKYKVLQANITKFELVYGSTGDWVKLFSKDKAYFKTDLLNDIFDRQSYLTIDYWESKEAKEIFRKKFKKEFEKLDEACARLTEAETFIGDFYIPKKFIDQE